MKTDLQVGDIQVGDMVKAVNLGETYPNYWSFFKEHNLGEILLDNIYNYNEVTIPQGSIAKVLFIGKHKRRGAGMVAVIKTGKDHTSFIHLINLEGIKRVKSEKEIKRDELVAKMEQVKRELEELEL